MMLIETDLRRFVSREQAAIEDKQNCPVQILGGYFEKYVIQHVDLFVD